MKGLRFGGGVKNWRGRGKFWRRREEKRKVPRRKFGGPFSIQIASAVAGQTFHLKRAAFVFRSQGCADPGKMEVNGKAEGRVNGQRRTVPLRIAAASTAGVFAVNREWPPEGVWVISLAAKCASATAGALVAAGENGPNREASRFLKQAATEAEIEAVLRAMGGK